MTLWSSSWPFHSVRDFKILVGRVVSHFFSNGNNIKNPCFALLSGIYNSFPVFLCLSPIDIDPRSIISLRCVAWWPRSRVSRNPWFSVALPTLWWCQPNSSRSHTSESRVVSTWWKGNWRPASRLLPPPPHGDLLQKPQKVRSGSVSGGKPPDNSTSSPFQRYGDISLVIAPGRRWHHHSRLACSEHFP